MHVQLIILDGFGLAPKGPGNAISLAKTPNFKYYWKKYPHTILRASGQAVGLPRGYQGNSEAGHMNIGAGRIVLQMLEKINCSIRSKQFFTNKAFLEAIKFVKKNNSSLHLLGLVQDEGVHAHQNHLYALLKLAKKYKLKPYIHFITDGRDTPPKSALKFLKQLEDKIKKIKIDAKIATVMGRYYAMDRDNRWQRTEKAYNTMLGISKYTAKSARKAILSAYKRGETDEFIWPTVIGNFEGVKPKDAIIFFNYRADRARQLTKAFIQRRFNKFERKYVPVKFVCMTDYYKGIKAEVAYYNEYPKNILGEIISKKGLYQLRISETEKYAHVTYFFNGQREKPFPKEERILIPSPKVATYDLKPEMSAYEITETLLEKMETQKYALIVCNLVNCDMVGHTGKKKAVIKAVEVVDECMGKLTKKALELGITTIITADHGNAEKIREDHKIITSHTTNPVPFILVSQDEKLQNVKLKRGILGNIAPTILDIMKIKKPKEMIDSLII